MSVTVYLANKGFVLPATPMDDRRREAYFKNPTDSKNQLVPEEEKILLALGINKEAFLTNDDKGSCLKDNMAQFFQQLPKCQSDTSLTLSKDCEIVQYVLWETLLAASARSQTAYADNFIQKKPLADISVAINQQIINDLKPKPEIQNDVDRLFTLIMKASIPAASAPAVDNSNELFTLMMKKSTVLAPPAPPSPPIPPESEPSSPTPSTVELPSAEPSTEPSA